MLMNGVEGYQAVEDRLIAAVRTCWRQPDRERAWLTVRSGMPEIVREARAGDYDARGGEAVSSDVALRPASLTRREVAEMEAAFAWLEVLDSDDRRLVGLVITTMARRDAPARVPWRTLLPKMGLTVGAGGLARRYSRAMGRVARRAMLG